MRKERSTITEPDGPSTRGARNRTHRRIPVGPICRAAGAPTILELVLELDRLGHRHTVLGDLWVAVRVVDEHATALGAESDLDGVGELVHAGQHRRAGVNAELKVLGTEASQLCARGDADLRACAHSCP